MSESLLKASEALPGKYEKNAVIKRSASDMIFTGDWKEAFQNRSKLPESAKTRAWWWWLNANVDREAIRRDLSEMAKIGFGGLNLFDGGGAARPGYTEDVPAGPLFGSPEWNSLFLFALNEAAKNHLEVSLNIQSGWNLGAPFVTPENAAWLIETSEIEINSDGKTPVKTLLPQPKTNENYYRDIAVFALPVKRNKESVRLDISAAGPPKEKITFYRSKKEHPPAYLIDNDPKTLWVSEYNPPVTLVFQFERKVEISGLRLLPRPGYGPKKITVFQVDKISNQKKTVGTFEIDKNKKTEIKFTPVQGELFQVRIDEAYDPQIEQKKRTEARNVQIAELSLIGPQIALRTQKIRNLADKTASRELKWSAPRAEFLMDDFPSVPNEIDARLDEIIEVTSFFVKADDHHNGDITALSQNRSQSGTITEELNKADRLYRKSDSELSDRSDPEKRPGFLNWTAPKGNWTIIRIGFTISSRGRVSTETPGTGGLCLNPLDPSAFDLYWNLRMKPLAELAGKHAGTVWKYCHAGSWELGGINWSRNFRSEFLKRRGYDLYRFLPIFADKIIESREVTNRFLNDLRRTIADCIAENHYDRFRDRALEYGLEIHPESGGPHGAPVDALMNIGHSQIPMMEFWCKSKTHRIKLEDRHFMKQAASAANIYNRHFVQAEGFTTIGPHWETSIGENLRPSFDFAACEGMNRLVWHTFVCIPKSSGFPGQVYFAGTHCNPNCIWWPFGSDFLDYLNRSQFLLQQGIASADVLVYYGDWVPNFVRGKIDDPAHVLPGYDYDVVNEEALIRLAQVKNGKIVFPSGSVYRVLVLPDRKNISLGVLIKIEQMIREGAVVIGPKPERTTGLIHGKIQDGLVKSIADRLWSGSSEKNSNLYGKGRVYWGTPVREVLKDLQVAPALEIVFADPDHVPLVPENTKQSDSAQKASESSGTSTSVSRLHIGDPIAWIRRTASDGSVVYLLSNQSNQPIKFTGIFRQDLSEEDSTYLKKSSNIDVSAPSAWRETVNILRLPEIWDPVTGSIRSASVNRQYSNYFSNGSTGPAVSGSLRTAVDLRLEPFQGLYVVFREKANSESRLIDRSAISKSNDPQYQKLFELCGKWKISFFRPESPDKISFSRTVDDLFDWSQSQEEQLKYFSGTAVYRLTFYCQGKRGQMERIWLNPGLFKEIGSISLNGKDLGIFWCSPRRFEVTDLLNYAPADSPITLKKVSDSSSRLISAQKQAASDQGRNELIITIKNTWPNALIGDSRRPFDQRVYRTNVIKFRSDDQLLPAGLLGPVTLEIMK